MSFLRLGGVRMDARPEAKPLLKPWKSGAGSVRAAVHPAGGVR